MPWLAVQVGGERGLYVGWEFSGLGRIHARAAADRSDRLDLDVGNHPDFKTDIEPGEAFLVPPAFVGCYRGDLDEGSYSLHRFVLEKLRPPLPQGCPDPILAYNLYLDVGGNKATEADVLRSAAVCRDLGFEAFMPDAMWFPETGDWRWDPRRFPRGIQPIEAFVHGAGMKLALWCAWTNGGISRASGGARACAARWGGRSGSTPITRRTGSRARSTAARSASACAEAQAVGDRRRRSGWSGSTSSTTSSTTSARSSPAATRRTTGTATASTPATGPRWATTRSRSNCVQAFPHLILENCSGGGHIKDFGVVRRTHYTVATDTLSNLPNRQAIYDSTFALPPLVLQCYTYDNVYPVRGDDPGTFLWRSAMMGAWQIDPTDTPKWTDEETAVRAAIGGDLSPVDPADAGRCQGPPHPAAARRRALGRHVLLEPAARSAARCTSGGPIRPTRGRPCGSRGWTRTRGTGCGAKTARSRPACGAATELISAGLADPLAAGRTPAT